MSAFGAECLEINYQATLNDVETDCNYLLKRTLAENHCSKDEIKNILSKIIGNDKTEIHMGSAKFCKYTLEKGILQIMTDDMDPNPRAAIFFSLWD